MKQHITPDQLNELSEEAKKRLREWCNEKHWADLDQQKYWLSTYDLGPDIERLFVNHGPLPLLSIGQMIEFLGVPPILCWIEREGWNIGFTVVENKSDLCDALWEAVKEVLEKPEEEEEAA